MTYLSYNGKKVIFSGKYVTSVSAPTGLVVVDFDGINDTVNFSANISDLDSNGKIVFNVYLDQDSGYAQAKFFNLKKDPSDSFRALLADSSIYFQSLSFSSGNKNKDISIAGRSGEILEIEVQFTADDPTSVKINNVSQTLYSNTPPSITSGGTSSIGSNAYDQFLGNATIWDVRTYTSDNAITHRWVGTGANANLDSAWVDVIGSLNPTVSGSPTTRIIPLP